MATPHKRMHWQQWLLLGLSPGARLLESDRVLTLPDESDDVLTLPDDVLFLMAYSLFL